MHRAGLAREMVQATNQEKIESRGAWLEYIRATEHTPNWDSGSRTRVIAGVRDVGNAVDLNAIGSRGQGERVIDQCAGRNVLGVRRGGGKPVAGRRTHGVRPR